MLIAVTFRDFIHKYGFFFLILLFMRFHVYAQHSEIKQPLIVKYGIFVKKLSQQFMILSQEIEGIDGDIPKDKYDILMA